MPRSIARIATLFIALIFVLPVQAAGISATCVYGKLLVPTKKPLLGGDWDISPVGKKLSPTEQKLFDSCGKSVVEKRSHSQILSLPFLTRGEPLDWNVRTAVCFEDGSGYEFKGVVEGKRKNFTIKLTDYFEFNSPTSKKYCVPHMKH